MSVIIIIMKKCLFYIINYVSNDYKFFTTAQSPNTVSLRFTYIA